MWREFEIKIHFEGQEDKKAQKNRAKSADIVTKNLYHDMTKKCQK